MTEQNDRWERVGEAAVPAGSSGCSERTEGLKTEYFYKKFNLLSDEHWDKRVKPWVSPVRMFVGDSCAVTADGEVYSPAGNSALQRRAI